MTTDILTNGSAAHGLAANGSVGNGSTANGSAAVFNENSDQKDVSLDDSKSYTNGHATVSEETKVIKKPKGFFEFETDIVWRNVVYITLMHIAVVYCSLTFNYLQDWRTTLWIFGMWFFSGAGGTAGAHRYWTHRSYKAKWPMRVLLMLWFYSAGQNRIIEWVKDHRVHHKYSDTDADPHNSKRGFFFSHVGWLMLKKHPEVIKKGRQIDVSDVLEDPVVAFGDKHFVLLRILTIFVIPTLIPVYLWNETWTRAFISQGIIRYIMTLNCAWSVNSFAHLWGSRPYDAAINPAQNFWVAIAAGGEGWHNYHHVFPWDYRAAESGHYINLTGTVIHFFHLIGWAYDLKQPSLELIRDVATKRGDGTYPVWREVPPPPEKKTN